VARVLLDEAYVRISLDDRGLEKSARRAGARAGRAFAKAAQKAAGEIEVRWNLNVQKLRGQLRALNETVTIQALVELADQEARAQLAALAAETITITANVVLDQPAIQAQLDQLAGPDGITIPGNVVFDQPALQQQLDQFGQGPGGLQIPVTPTFDPNDVQGLLNGIKEPQLPARVKVDPAELQRHLDSLPKPKLKVDADPSHIAAQIAAGIRAGEALGGDIQIGSNFLINRALLRAQLAALKPRIRVALDVDKATLEKFKQIKIPAKLDVDKNALGRFGKVTIPADLKVDDAAIRRLGKQITIPVRVRTDGDLPSQGPDLTALVHINGTALNGAVKSIEDHFRASPIKLVAQVYADDRAVEEVRRKTATKHLTLPVAVELDDRPLDELTTEKLRKRTLEIDLDVQRGPSGTRLFDELNEKTRHLTLELDVREGPDGTRVEELLDHPDRTLQLTVKLNDDATRRLDELATEQLTVDVRAAVDEATVRLAREEITRAIDANPPTVDIRADLDTASVETATERIRRLIGELTVRVTVVLANAAEFRAELERLLRDATIRVNALLDAGTILEQLDALTRNTRVVLRAVLDADQFRLDLAALSGGEVSVRAVLDAAQLRADLAALGSVALDVRLNVDRREFAAQVAALNPVELDVVLDLNRREFGAQIDALSPVRLDVVLLLNRREFAAQISALNPVGLDVDLHFDRREFAAQIAALNPVELDVVLALDAASATRVRAQVERMRPTITAHLGLDAGDVAAVRTRIERMRPTITARLDVDRDLPTLRAVKVRAELDIDQAALRGLDAVKIRAELDIDQAHFREQVARLSPVHIRAEVDVDRDRITRALGDAGRVGGEALSNGIGDAVNGGGGGGGLGGLTSSLGGIVGPLVQAGALASALAIAGAGIAAAFGAVATAVAALPGLIGLAGAAVGAIALGMDGIKAAAKALQPEFDQLKSAVSAAFQTGLAPAFEQLKAVFPALQTGLVGVAGGLSTVAKGLADALTSGEGLSNLQLIFDNVKTSLVNMTPGIQLITGAFLKMASQSGVFDILTTTVNRFGSAFSSSVGRLLADGNTMQKAFQGLGDVLGSTAEGFVSLVENGIKLFSTAAPGVVSFLDQLTGFFNKFDYKALGGAVGSVFQGLGDAIGAIPQGVIDQIVQSFKALGAIFQQSAIQTGIQQMAAAFPSVIQIIGSLTEVFFTLAGAFSSLGPGLSAILSGLSAGISAAAPGLTALGTAISQVAIAVAPLLVPLGQIAGILAGAFAQAITALLPAFNALVPALTQVATIFATTLAAAVQQLAPLFVELAPVIAEVARVVGDALVQAMTAIAPLIPDLVQAVVSLVQAFIPLIPPILQIVSAVIPPLIAVFRALIPIITAVINVVALIVTAVVAVIAPVISFGATIAGVFTNMAAKVITVITDIVAKVVGGFGDFTSKAVSTVSGWVNSVTTFFGNLGTQANAKINEMINGIVTYFRGLPGQALGALSGFAGQMVTLGGQVIQGLLNGLRNAGGAVIDYLTNLASQALQSAKSFLGIASPSRVFRDQIGEQIGAGLAIGIQRSTSGVVDAAEAMGQAAVDAVDVSGAGKAADKIIAQITGARGGDGSSLGDYIANTVTDALGNLTVKANAAGQQVEAVVNTTDRDRDLLDELRGLRTDVQGLEVHGGDTTIDIDVAASVAEAADEINSRLRTQSALGVFQR
jgi:phage-related protein